MNQNNDILQSSNTLQRESQTEIIQSNEDIFQIMDKFKNIQNQEKQQNNIYEQVIEENMDIIKKLGVSREEVIEFKQAFDFFDVDEGGSLDKKELQKAFGELGFGAKDSLETLLQTIDKDGNQNIDFREFLLLMTKQISSQDTEEDMMNIFNYFDIDSKGAITIKDLRYISKEIGVNADDYVLQEMIKQASGGKQEVNVKNFIDIINKGTLKDVEYESIPQMVYSQTHKA